MGSSSSWVTHDPSLSVPEEFGADLPGLDGCWPNLGLDQHQDHFECDLFWAGNASRPGQASAGWRPNGSQIPLGHRHVSRYTQDAAGLTHDTTVLKP